METVFKRQAMRLCNIPHPNGYTYAPIHFGVDYSPQPVMGARVWASFSPYPSFDDRFENPCVVYAEDFEDYPTQFKAYKNNPIFERARLGVENDRSFNADPDLIIHNNQIHVINRPWYRTTSNALVDVRCDYFKSIGSNSLDTFEKLITLYKDEKNVFASPSLVFFNGKFRIYDLITSSWNKSNGSCKALRIFEADELRESSVKFLKNGSILGYKIEPWHLSVFNHNGKLYSIVSAKSHWSTGFKSGAIYLGEFDKSGENLVVYSKPLTDFVTYRSDAYVDERGLFVLYASYFDNDRQIYADSIDFEYLLKLVK